MEPEPKPDRRPKGTIWVLALVAFAVVAVVAVVAAVFGFRRSDGEPSIRGRTLTEWTQQFAKNAPGSPENLEARQAIRDIGMDAIPYLLLCIEGKPTTKDKVSDFLRTNGLPKLAGWFGGGALDMPGRAWNAISVFGVLGTNAVSAVPKLAPLVDRRMPPTRPQAINYPRMYAALAMAQLGREGQLQLLSRFPDPEKDYAYGSSQEAEDFSCVRALSHQRRFEPEVLATMHRYAKSSDFRFRLSAFSAIQSLEGNLELKRSLLDGAFKIGYPRIWGLLGSNPELVEEFRDRIEGLRNLTDPDTIAVRNRLLASTNSLGK